MHALEQHGNRRIGAHDRRESLTPVVATLVGALIFASVVTQGADPVLRWGTTAAVVGVGLAMSLLGFFRR